MLKINTNQTADVVLKYPASGDECSKGEDIIFPDGSKLMVTVYKADSSIFKKARNKMADARAKSKKTLTAQQVDAQMTDLVCAAVQKIHNFDKLDLDGRGLGYITKDTFHEIVGEYDWIKDQINEATGNADLFTETAFEKPKKS